MICGCISIVAEMSYEALKKRHSQGWIDEVIDDLETLMKRTIKARNNKEVKRFLIKNYLFKVNFAAEISKYVGNLIYSLYPTHLNANYQC